MKLTLPSSKLLYIALLILFFGGLLTSPAFSKDKSQAIASNTENKTQRGQIVYHRFCSYCHGKKLQGQANWRTRKPDGKLPAPPHDETGHTWHHADELLFGIIKFGLIPPYAPENYESDMPAWEGTLSDEDIRAVLSYIKSQWPAETQKIQAEIDRDSKK